MSRVVKVKSLSELPKVIKLGTYEFRGVRVRVVESMSREAFSILIKSIKEAESRGWV